MTATPHRQFPDPAGATVVGDFEDLQTDTPFRYFEGARRTIGRPHRDDVEVYISGVQHRDGSITRDVVVHELHHDHPLTVEQARQLAAALAEVVAEAEQMNGYDKGAV
jgi:hypothetical protein